MAQLLSDRREEKGERRDISVIKFYPKYLNNFTQHITDDFDIPGAVATMWEMIKDENVDQNEKLNMLLAFDTILDIGIRGTRDRIANFSERIIEEVNELIAQRNQFRKEKQWEQADKIRTELDEKGIKIEDTAEGTVWY